MKMYEVKIKNLDGSIERNHFQSKEDAIRWMKSRGFKYISTSWTGWFEEWGTDHLYPLVALWFPNE